MNEEKSCGAVVYFQASPTDRHYLLIQHQNGGHWSFPKGHVEAGETEAETALREINEETGLDVTLDTQFRAVTRYMPTEHITKEVIYFLGRADDTTTERQIEEVQQVQWLSYNEAMTAITYENDQTILAQAEAYLTQ